MRRPLKPFVTEYRGARRPHSNQPQNLDTAREGAPAGQGSRSPGQTNGTGSLSPWPSDPYPSHPWASDADVVSNNRPRPRPRPVDTNAAADSEDSYEAALRAADALFTRPEPTHPPAPTNAPSPAAPPSRTAPDPNAPSALDAAPSQASPAAPERGGRILPVIDEAPLPQFAALEAAYAPKRRGRKPGSKNKPKPDAEIKPDTDLPMSPTPELYARVSQSALLDDDDPDEMAPASLAPAQMAPTPALQTLEAVATSIASRGQKRTGRVSERAKPGEGWKRRRLPRVCW